jgi:hypothetical protein
MEAEKTVDIILLWALVDRWRARAETSRQNAAEQPTPEEETFWEGAAFSLDIAARELTALISLQIQGEDAGEAHAAD